MLGDDEALRQFEANLGVILGRLDAALRASGSSLAEVGCIQTVYNPFEPDAVDGGNHGAEAHSMAPRRASRGGFNRAVRNAAAARRLRLIEVSGMFRGRCAELTWVRSGDIHPTDDGHALIAGAYLEACGGEIAATATGPGGQPGELAEPVDVVPVGALPGAGHLEDPGDGAEPRVVEEAGEAGGADAALADVGVAVAVGAELHDRSRWRGRGRVGRSRHAVSKSAEGVASTPAAVRSS